MDPEDQLILELQIGVAVAVGASFCSSGRMTVTFDGRNRLDEASSNITRRRIQATPDPDDSCRREDWIPAPPAVGDKYDTECVGKVEKRVLPEPGYIIMLELGREYKSGFLLNAMASCQLGYCLPHMPTHAHTRTHTRAPMRPRAYTYTHTHTHTISFLFLCVHACVRACVREYVRALMYQWWIRVSELCITLTKFR